MYNIYAHRPLGDSALWEVAVSLIGRGHFFLLVLELLIQVVDAFSQNIRSGGIELFHTKSDFFFRLLINSKLDGDV